MHALFLGEMQPTVLKEHLALQEAPLVMNRNDGLPHREL